MLLFTYGATNDIENNNGEKPLDLATKLDKIKLEKKFIFQRQHRSLSRKSRLRSKSSFLEWDISAISLTKVSPKDSDLNSPTNFLGLKRYLSTGTKQRPEKSKIDPWELPKQIVIKDESQKFKRKKRRGYDSLFTEQKDLFKKWA